jgi:hypothetical protein
MESIDPERIIEPSIAELRAWWEEQKTMQEFYDTPLGHAMHSALYLGYLQWKEHKYYRQLVIDHAERTPIAQPLHPPKP